MGAERETDFPGSDVGWVEIREVTASVVAGQQLADTGSHGVHPG